MKLVNGVARFNLDDEADLTTLIKTKVFWTASGPDALRKALDFLQAHPDLITPELLANVPPSVADLLTQAGAATPQEAVESPEAPVAQPVAAEAVVAPQEGASDAPTA